MTAFRMRKSVALGARRPDSRPVPARGGCRFHSADRPDRVSPALRRIWCSLAAATATAALLTGAASPRTGGPRKPARRDGRGGDLLLPLVRHEAPRRRLAALAAERQRAAVADRVRAGSRRAAPYSSSDPGGRPRADARDRLARRPDRDRLVVGPRLGRGRAAAARRCGPRGGRASGRVARRAVRRADACGARSRELRASRARGSPISTSTTRRRRPTPIGAR